MYSFSAQIIFMGFFEMELTLTHYLLDVVH